MLEDSVGCYPKYIDLQYIQKNISFVFVLTVSLSKCFQSLSIGFEVIYASVHMDIQILQSFSFEKVKNMNAFKGILSNNMLFSMSMSLPLIAGESHPFAILFISMAVAWLAHAQAPQEYMN